MSLPIPQANAPVVDPKTGVLTEPWRRFLLALTEQFAATSGTFATRPSPGVEGMLISVSDSTTAVWGETITGGGANHVLGYFNGTTWSVAGK